MNIEKISFVNVISSSLSVLHDSMYELYFSPHLRSILSYYFSRKYFFEVEHTLFLLDVWNFD